MWPKSSYMSSSQNFLWLETEEMQQKKSESSETWEGPPIGTWRTKWATGESTWDSLYHLHPPSPSPGKVLSLKQPPSNSNSPPASCLHDPSMKISDSWASREKYYLLHSFQRLLFLELLTYLLVLLPTTWWVLEESPRDIVIYSLPYTFIGLLLRYMGQESGTNTLSFFCVGPCARKLFYLILGGTLGADRYIPVSFLHSLSFFNPRPRAYPLILERKEGKEWEGERTKHLCERNIDGLPSVHAPTRNQTRSLGMCPEQKSNPWPFGA